MSAATDDGAGRTVIEADLRARRGALELVASFRSDAPITGVVGPSGAGKTTLLDALAGLLPGVSGRLLVGGVTLLDSERGVALPPHRRRIGYVFQDSRLFPHLDVAANLDFGRPPSGDDGGRDGAPDRRSVIDALELTPLLQRRPAELSGGETRRVALGRALLTRPRLLLLDEPLSALDPGLRAQVRRYLMRVRERFSVPLLYVGHDLEELLGLTRRFLVVAAGRAIACGDYFELLAREDVFAVADRLGLGNVLDVEVLERDEEAGITRARLAPSDGPRASVTALSMPPWPLAPGERLHVALRPQDVLLAKSAPAEISAQNALEGEVDAMAEVQGRVMVRVDVAGAPILAELTPRACQRLGLERGVPVVCLFKTHALRRVGDA